jgi:hypothetical protein
MDGRLTFRQLALGKWIEVDDKVNNVRYLVRITLNTPIREVAGKKGLHVLSM